MFENADRLPAGAPIAAALVAVRPWGLRRMAPYKDATGAGYVATRIDPVTQMGVAADGGLVDAKHKRSNTGTLSRRPSGCGVRSGARGRSGSGYAPTGASRRSGSTARRGLVPRASYRGMSAER
ncbi:putative ATP-grasp-modified RiPP [Spirillospora sp. NPDC052242]